MAAATIMAVATITAAAMRTAAAKTATATKTVAATTSETILCSPCSKGGGYKYHLQVDCYVFH